METKDEDIIDYYRHAGRAVCAREDRSASEHDRVNRRLGVRRRQHRGKCFGDLHRTDCLFCLLPESISQAQAVKRFSKFLGPKCLADLHAGLTEILVRILKSLIRLGWNSSFLNFC